MPTPHNYNTILYPQNIDTLRLVSNGSTPDNRVTAELINKLTRIVTAIEQHMQYSVATATVSGYYILIGRGFLQLQADLPNPGLLQNVPVTAFFGPANSFSGNPFARQHALFVNAAGYHIVGGQRNYFSVRSAVNTGQELGNLTLNVNVVKTSGDKWRAGDVIETTVMIVRFPVPE